MGAALTTAGDERLFQAVLAAALRQAGLQAELASDLFQPGKGLADLLGLSSASTDILYAKGHALLLAGQFTQAAQAFSASLMISPPHRDSRLGLSMALAGDGHVSEAAQLLARLAGEYPADAVVLARCMEMQARAGDREAAQRTLALFQKSDRTELSPALAKLARQIAALLES